MRNRKFLALILASIVWLLLSTASPVLGEGPDLYPGVWRSGIGIKDLSGADNTIRVLFYDAATGAKQAYEYTTTLSAGAGIELYLPNISSSELAAGSYAVEVQSTGPVGVMATNTNYDANMADSYNAVPSATEFFVPGIYHNHNNWWSELLVQNVNDSAVDVSIQVTGEDLVTRTPVGPVTFGPITIPAHGTRSFDTGTDTPIDFAPLGDHFRGSARVTNSQGLPMAVALLDTRVAAGSPAVQVVLSHRGTTVEDADTFLTAPILYKNFNNCWRSGITVQNVDSTNAVDVRLTVRSSDGSITATNVQTLQPGRSYEWYLPSAVFDGGATLPDQFLGAGTVEVISGSGKIVGTVLTTNYCRVKTLPTAPAGAGLALGYIMPGRTSGKAVLSAPTVYKTFGTGIWNSSLVVSNVGASAVTLELQFASLPNSPAQYSGTMAGGVLQPGQSTEFYLPKIPQIPDQFLGSILVTATGAGTPAISGLVQHVNYGRGVATVYAAPGY